jgi:hypothetical protein
VRIPVDVIKEMLAEYERVKGEAIAAHPPGSP